MHDLGTEMSDPLSVTKEKWWWETLWPSIVIAVGVVFYDTLAGISDVPLRTCHDLLFLGHSFQVVSA